MATPWRRLGVYLELVYSFPATILVGAGLGYLVDRWLGTGPYGVLVGFVIGSVGAFVYLIKMLNTIKNRKDSGDGA
jgi:ATP synthase protein I